jgi:hypothetical protein
MPELGELAVHCFGVYMESHGSTWLPRPDLLHSEMSVWTPGVLFPRNTLRKQGGFDEHLRIAADYEVLLKLRMNGTPFTVHSSVLTCYKGAGLSTKYREIGFFEECLIQLRNEAQSSDECFFRAARKAVFSIDISKLSSFRRWQLALKLGRLFLY